MKKIALILFLTILFTGPLAFLQAQHRPQKAPNLAHYDKKKFHFGFMLGYNHADFAIKPKTNLNDFDSLMIIETHPMSGFNIGIVSDLHMGEHFNLRFIPEISLLDRNVVYNMTYKNNSLYKVQKKIESVSLDFPVLLKLNLFIQNMHFMLLSHNTDRFGRAKQKQNKDIVKLKITYRFAITGRCGHRHVYEYV